ncbi:hypothetical protein STP4a_119 [Salmonella phage STP4-a]|uniref:Uncharacterized protein n=1 Tax=Salmonella phage STP4-a TaxID=1445860 RepID=A0A0B4LAA6_9CAUD|nr:hypothetical protein STP4a_119 [Salmonella phage STP4-a]AHJ86973.1 hypothetical protein STP4a_119 [Salmonella phage STP4-a]UFK27244.1 hypothetical protein LG358_00223 [Escherichia phage UoN_LG358_1]
MKTYDEFITEALLSQIAEATIKDTEGSTKFALVTDKDGVYFQIGNERFQTSKLQTTAIVKVLRDGGKWKGSEGSTQIGVAVDNDSAFFRIGAESFTLSSKAFKELKAAFK